MDSELLKSLKAGDENAVIEFINLYRQRIYCYAYRVAADVEDALDITQDVLIKIINGINNLDETKVVDAYIHKITVNRAYDYLRIRYKPQRLQDLMSIFAKRQPTPAESYRKEELRERVLRAVNKLPEKERKIIMLKYFQDLKIREIAEVLDITEGTVKKQMFRARERLEEILRKEIR